MPLSYKPGGFARGAGHGATFTDNLGNYWHTSTIAISVKNNFERRIGIWPAGFDNDGVMFCNTAFGDYPHYLPTAKTQDYFTGWMLLNYNKPVEVSSSLGDHPANNAVDENIRTYWSAKSGNKGEWIITDLGEIATVRAIQLNFADQDAEFLGKTIGKAHQYQIFASNDKKNWRSVVDKRQNTKDVPHDYIELDKPLETRYLKIVNHQMPTGKFALSGLRVFGKGKGSVPEQVGELIVLRTEKDKRSAWIKWKPVDDAYAYNLYMGLAPDKLYNCVMIYGANEYWLKTLDKDETYYFTIEAINENGVSQRLPIQKVN